MATRRKTGPKTPKSKTGSAKPANSAQRGSKRTRGSDEAPAGLSGEGEQSVALHDIAQARYLNYALSVITSRALPDVRDGLKPVQRRILYTMWQQRLTSDAKHRKCAKVVGDVMGNYHPHGDASIYDALVRLAQSFSLRAPLVEGSGNFGSMDGDAAAAMRYTECRLAPISTDLLSELAQDTVEFRPNYDGTRSEPVVLPAKWPNLLINGATGIAVGMATNIPPHNPEEVCTAAIRLLDALGEGKTLSARELCRTIKGPDFPTGGQIISTAEELKVIYETGTGSVKVRGTYKIIADGRGNPKIHITSIPYTVNKATLVERIAEVALSRKLPLLVDVKDISTDDVCIEVELKKEADPKKVLAYLFKQTPLQTTFSVNLTCLVPTENPQVCRPERVDLQSLLWHFLNFRLQVVTKRHQHELAALQARIHILEGFAKVFDALDEIIKLIRKSEGKADAARQIMARFKLDAEQTDAILELKLYRLARLEILVIQNELKDRRKRAAEIKKLLSESEARGLWQIIRTELTEMVASFAKFSKRRTLIASVEEEPEFSAEDLIVAEDNHVLLTRDGWIKRQKEIKDPGSTRLREGDAVLSCVAGSTRATVAFFSNFGTAYTCRIIDIPATTGYGEPIQKLFKLKDNERILGCFSLDSRLLGDIKGSEDYMPESYLVAATSDGYALAFGLEPYSEPSTRAGRRFARPSDGSEVVGVELVHGKETLIAVSKGRRALLCSIAEINYLTNPGKGVTLLKLEGDDTLLGIKAVADKETALVVKSSLGGEQKINAEKYERSTRGGKGREVMKRGSLTEIVPEVPAAPAAFEEGN